MVTQSPRFNLGLAFIRENTQMLDQLWMDLFCSAPKVDKRYGCQFRCELQLQRKQMEMAIFMAAG